MCYISYNLKKKTKNEIFIVFCFWKLAQLGGPGLLLWKVAVRALAGAGSPVCFEGNGCALVFCRLCLRQWCSYMQLIGTVCGQRSAVVLLVLLRTILRDHIF